MPDNKTVSLGMFAAAAFATVICMPLSAAGIQNGSILMAVVALLFALFHTNPVQIPSLFVAGVCYGVLTLLFGSIWPAIIAHAINNGIAVLLAKYNDFIRYILQDRLFIIIAIVA